MQTSKLAFVMAMIYGTAAFAHPEVQSSQPSGGAATTSPRQISITFNEAVFPQFSGIELKDKSGKAILTGKAATDPTNKKVLIVPLKEPLAPGGYIVEWHAVSDDTHRVKGSYSFSVTP